MSKIVILNKIRLEAPQIIEDLISKIKIDDPIFAEFVEQFDVIPIIKECANNALTRLGEEKGIKRDSTVADYGGSTYGGKIDGSLKTDRLPNGLGIRVNDKGAIEFISDDYRPGWKEEIKRLRELFTVAFRAEAYKSLLTIKGYEVIISSAKTSDGELHFNVEGVKQ